MAKTPFLSKCFFFPGIEAVVDIHESKESRDVNDEKPSDGGFKTDEQSREGLQPDEQSREGLQPDEQSREGLQPDEQSREGLQPDEQSREGIKSVQKIRTPSDIFSFYDISRDGATTV